MCDVIWRQLATVTSPDDIQHSTVTSPDDRQHTNVMSHDDRQHTTVVSHEDIQHTTVVSHDDSQHTGAISILSALVRASQVNTALTNGKSAVCVPTDANCSIELIGPAVTPSGSRLGGGRYWAGDKTESVRYAGHHGAPRAGVPSER